MPINSSTGNVILLDLTLFIHNLIISYDAAHCHNIMLKDELHIHINQNGQSLTNLHKKQHFLLSALQIINIIVIIVRKHKIHINNITNVSCGFALQHLPRLLYSCLL